MVKIINKSHPTPSSPPQTPVVKKRGCLLGRTIRRLFRHFSSTIRTITSLFHRKKPQFVTPKPMPPIHHLKANKPGGMANGGNTCFLAAYISSLFASKSAVDALFKNNAAYPANTSTEQQKNIKELREHLKKMYTEVSQGKTVSKEDTKELRMKLHRVDPTKVSADDVQDDPVNVHELVCQAIDIKPIQFNTEYKHSNSDKTFDLTEKKLDKVYTLRQTISPMQPKAKDKANETYNLQQCLDDSRESFDTTLRKEDQNGRKIPLPKGTETRVKIILDGQAPLFLPILIDRIGFDPMTAEPIKQSFHILGDDLLIPIENNMDGKYARYKRVAGAIHEGKTPKGGHWISYVQREQTEKDKPWFKCNDSSVKKVKDSKAESVLQQGSYFFYELQGIIQDKG